MDKEILQNLEKLGLSGKEAAVYVSLLMLGEVGSYRQFFETLWKLVRQ